MNGRHAKCRIPRMAFLISLAACFLTQSAIADEVDDILVLKAKNRDRIKSYSAEYVVETKLPKDKAGNAKTAKMRYRMRMERLPKGKAKGLLNPWKTEIDVLEPYALSMKVEDERVWLKKGNDWTEQEMTPQMHEQFTGMGERFLGADPAEQRKHFDIRIIRQNNPILGPHTRTVEYVAKGNAFAIPRLQEDVNADGLALAIRVFDRKGGLAARMAVTRHHKVEGIPLIDAMEAVGRSVTGDIVVKTSITNIRLETR